MQLKHSSDLYRIQLFVVWVWEEPGALELFNFSERAARQVFCIGYHLREGWIADCRKTVSPVQTTRAALAKLPNAAARRAITSE
jgi:hypothetical protein